jgi:hypothetical protein
MQRPGGVPVKQVRQRSQDRPQVFDQNAGQVHIPGFFADIGNGPLPDRLVQKFPLEVGALAEKQGPWDHLTGVVGDQRHRSLPVQRLRQGRGQQGFGNLIQIVLYLP